MYNQRHRTKMENQAGSLAAAHANDLEIRLAEQKTQLNKSHNGKLQSAISDEQNRLMVVHETDLAAFSGILSRDSGDQLTRETLFPASAPITSFEYVIR